MKNRFKCRENVRPPGVKVMDLSSFQDLTSKAQARSRLRQHLNLHTSYDEYCQRLLNAIEPDSYIRPHRHEFRSMTEVETLLVLQGSVALIVFDDNGVVDFSESGDGLGPGLGQGRNRTLDDSTASYSNN